MELLGAGAGADSSFNHNHYQHRDGDVFESGFPFYSSAELDSLASDDCIDAEEIEQKSMTRALPTTQEIEEHLYELTSRPTGEELDASLLLRGEQICSDELNENGAGYCTEIRRNLDVQSEESQVFSPEEEEREEIKAGASSCKTNGFPSVLNNENFDPVQEAAVESDGRPAGPCDINKLARPYQRDSTVNYVLESAKFVTFLIGSLLQLSRVLKWWATKTLMKPKAIPTLTKKKVENNERRNFTSEGPSIREQQNGRENVCSEDLAGALGFPLGMSIATVLAEILGNNYCLKHSISGEEISELLALAIRESLYRVSGIDCSRLVRDFEVAFTSTFKTIMQVKQVHYQNITSYPVDEKISTSDAQMPGLAAVSFVNGAKVEYADALANLRESLREKRDCSQIVKQTSGRLGSGQRIGMKAAVHQSCEPSFLESTLEVTSTSKDEFLTENYREEQKSRSCITETVNSKDCNDLTSLMSSAVNQHTGNVSKPNPEMEFANNEIENISQKLKNIKLDSADCKHSSMEGIPSISNVSVAPTATSIEQTYCSQLIEKTSGSLGSGQIFGMKGGVHQSCKPSFLKSDVQDTSNSKDVLPRENCRVEQKSRSYITEIVNPKDRNDLTSLKSCAVNQHAGNVSKPNWEMGFANSEIEDISQKWKNVKLDFADCKHSSVENVPSIANATLAPTDTNTGENDSDLASALYETGRTTDMAIACLSQHAVLQGQFQRQLAKSTSKVFDKSIMEQERSNNLREVEIGLTMRSLRLKEAKMFLDAESNELQRHSISMNQSKTSFKENKFIDRKLGSVYVELNMTCADHLMAGLVLMLFALAYGSWKYSYAHLSNSFEVCQVPKEPRKSSWFYNPMDSVTWLFEALRCGFTVIVRLWLGLAVIGFFAYSLLRRTIASSSQTMPTTIIVLFLGLICGYAGKLSVDNLGGNGFQWLVQWECFCLLHALSACFPASLFCVLNGSVSCHEGVKKKPLLGLRKFIFHTILLVLPIMTGLTPFASVKEWTNHFSLIISDNVLEPVRISVRDCLAQFLVV